jgi:hypothetical protein
MARRSETLRGLLNIDLSTFVSKSDEGSRPACDLHQVSRPFLVALGRGPVAHEIGNLVRCRCDADVDRVNNFDKKRFSLSGDDELGKISLCFRRDKNRC